MKKTPLTLAPGADARGHRLRADRARSTRPACRTASVAKPGLVAAGRPSPEAVASLKARGFRTVIDLRTPTEPGFAEEKAAVEAQGLRYVNVPVAGGAFSGTDVDAVKAALDQAAGRPDAAALRELEPRRRRVGGPPGPGGSARRRRPRRKAQRVGLTSPALAEAARRVAAEGTPRQALTQLRGLRTTGSWRCP